MTSENVVVYSQPSCPPCKIVKEFLTHYNIPFTEYNVKKDIKARDEMINKYDSMSTPTIIIGEKAVIGFEPDKLAELLEINLEV